MDKYFFRWQGESVTYVNPEAIAQFLDKYPEASAEYLESCFDLITVVVNWGDYRSAKELLAIALEGHAIHQEHKGKAVLR